MSSSPGRSTMNDRSEATKAPAGNITQARRVVLLSDGGKEDCTAEEEVTGKTVCVYSFPFSAVKPRVPTSFGSTDILCGSAIDGVLKNKREAEDAEKAGWIARMREMAEDMERERKIVGLQ